MTTRELSTRDSHMTSKPALVVVDVQNGFVNDESRHGQATPC
jgi:nicotinamidase-related amidase